jgi:hypothetical protein
MKNSPISGAVAAPLGKLAKPNGANSAWQQLAILAHNLVRSFQLHSSLATLQPPARQRTYSYRNRAARLSGRPVLRCSSNPATVALYGRIAERFVA